MKYRRLIGMTEGYTSPSIGVRHSMEFPPAFEKKNISANTVSSRPPSHNFRAALASGFCE